MNLLELLFYLCVLYASFLLYFKSVYRYWSRRNVPYLEPEVPFGNFKNNIKGKEQISVNLKHLYNEVKSRGWKYAGIYLFNKPTILVADLDLIKTILTKDFNFFVDRGLYYNEKDPLNAHLLNVCGSRWKQLRRKLTPNFTSGKMKAMFNIMRDCQSGLRKRMEEECATNKPIDIREVLACYTTNIIGSCAFGLDCNALEEKNSKFRHIGRKTVVLTKYQHLKETFAWLFPEVAKFLHVSTLRRKEVNDFIAKMVADIIHYREKNNVTCDDFMQKMIEFKNKVDDNGRKFTMDDIGSQCFVFFTAGFDTSSSLMAYVLYNLGKNQQIQDKLREEIRTVLAEYDDQITYDSLQEMTYLNQVIDESLRINPSIGTTTRLCVEDYKIPDEDAVIEKGTVVFVPILGIHHDAELYPNPTKFDPERFSEDCRKTRHNYAHLPFGEGPRNCIGLRFALLESKVGLVSLLKDYKFSVNEKTKEPFQYKPSFVSLVVEGEIWLNAEKI